MRLGLVLPVAAAALLHVCSSGTALAQTSDAPRYNTQCNRDAKPGRYACKYPGNLYGVASYTKKRKPSSEDIRDLDRQVFMRAAQLAIENDREFFTMTGDKANDTYREGKTRYVAGTAGYTTAQQCGVAGAGIRYCYPGQSVAGTPGYSYQERGVAGRDAFVKLWTADEKRQIEAGQLKRVVDSALFDAAGTYREYIGRTEGRWPTLIQLYADRIGRFEKIAKTGGPEARAAEMTVMRTWMRLSLEYGLAGRTQDAAEALRKATSYTSIGDR